MLLAIHHVTGHVQIYIKYLKIHKQQNMKIYITIQKRTYNGVQTPTKIAVSNPQKSLNKRQKYLLEIDKIDVDNRQESLLTINKNIFKQWTKIAFTHRQKSH
jgi:DNA-binding transcriptional regulator WhiA